MYCTCGNFNGLCTLWISFLCTLNLGSLDLLGHLIHFSWYALKQFCWFMTNPTVHFTGFSLRADGVVEQFHLHCVDDVLCGFHVQLSFWTSLLNSSLLTGHTSLACLLMFSVAVACDCPQTVRQLLVQRYRRSVRCWILAELNWTEHGSATMYVVKYSGACHFGCALLWHCESCCRPPTALRTSVCRGCPCRDPPMCLDAQGGIKAKRQPFCGCWSVVLSIKGPRDITALPLHALRVQQQLLIHCHWNCENTYRPGGPGRTRHLGLH